MVTLDSTNADGSISLSAQGRLEINDEFQTVWKISNGTNETRSVTLTALDSDFAQTLDLSPNSDTYVLSDEDGCADNPAPLQDALWAAESEGLLKVLIDSGAAKALRGENLERGFENRSAIAGLDAGLGAGFRHDQQSSDACFLTFAGCFARARAVIFLTGPCAVIASV